MNDWECPICGSHEYYDEDPEWEICKECGEEFPVFEED